jgi:hypothetical protein
MGDNETENNELGIHFQKTVTQPQMAEPVKQSQKGLCPRSSSLFFTRIAAAEAEGNGTSTIFSRKIQANRDPVTFSDTTHIMRGIIGNVKLPCNTSAARTVEIKVTVEKLIPVVKARKYPKSVERAFFQFGNMAQPADSTPLIRITVTSDTPTAKPIFSAM